MAASKLIVSGTSIEQGMLTALAVHRAFEDDGIEAVVGLVTEVVSLITVPKVPWYGGPTPRRRPQCMSPAHCDHWCCHTCSN